MSEKTNKIATVEKMRKFASGAIRHSDEGKLDFEGFLSPLVLERYAEYMHKHRLQADGSSRGSDNWQRGLPVSVYIKSLWRHFFAVWKGYRSGQIGEDDLCALLFNAMGIMHELMVVKPRNKYFREGRDVDNHIDNIIITNLPVTEPERALPQ